MSEYNGKVQRRANHHDLSENHKIEIPRHRAVIISPYGRYFKSYCIFVCCFFHDVPFFSRSALRVVLLFRAMRAMLAKHHTQKPSGTYDMPMMLNGELFILYLFILDSVTCNIFVLAAFHTIRTGTHTISFHWTVYRIWSVYLGFSLVMFTLSYMHMECIAIEKREKKIEQKHNIRSICSMRLFKIGNNNKKKCDEWCTRTRTKTMKKQIQTKI